MDFFIRNLSTLGPVGIKLPAPGTFGSLAGLILFCFLFWFSPLSPMGVMILFSVLFIVGIPLCTQAEILLGKEDPSEVIWDEFTSIPLVFVFCLDELNSFSVTKILFLLTMGFILFRIFDIAKPIGIKKLQNLPKGMGVMIDDLAAAFVSALILHALKTFPLSFL
ncbi:MAG: phosphatidylglycerophosphatase A [Opitutales bacterium]|nr:phosphatidylglycerophosphatase A [Opitutales bacterium]